jgi:hypothetical protein
MESMNDFTTESKEKKTISFLKKLLKLCKENDIRISVIGGYGLDGLLGQLTQKHNDLDLIALRKDREKLINLIRELNDPIEVSASGERIYALRIQDVNLEIITFELFSLSEEYLFSLDEIFPKELYGRIQSLQFRTPSVQIHRKIGDMYIEYFQNIGKELDMDKIERREKVLCRVEKFI